VVSFSPSDPHLPHRKGAKTAKEREEQHFVEGTHCSFQHFQIPHLISTSLCYKKKILFSTLLRGLCAFEVKLLQLSTALLDGSHSVPPP
jgi:hypothetical protein